MKQGLFCFFILILLKASIGQGAILWEPSSAKSGQSRFDYDRTEEAKEVSSFWSTRKMGVGVSAAGAYGLIGGLLAIHFHPQWSVDLGYGGGSHFQSFGFRIKKMLLLSSPLNPYIGIGFNRWERTNTRPFNVDDVSPGYISRRFLSDEDRRTSNIDEKLISGTLGIQYTFTNGDLEGYGFFVEGLFLVSVVDRQNAPTASFGLNYFF